MYSTVHRPNRHQGSSYWYCYGLCDQASSHSQRSARILHGSTRLVSGHRWPPDVLAHDRSVQPAPQPRLVTRLPLIAHLQLPSMSSATYGDYGDLQVLCSRPHHRNRKQVLRQACGAQLRPACGQSGRCNGKLPDRAPLPSVTTTARRPRLSSGMSTGHAALQSTTHRPLRFISGRITALHKVAALQ